MSDEIPDLQKDFIHAHKRMLNALRNILAFIGAATLAIGAAAVTMPVLSGAIWERLAGAWGRWSDPVNTIVSAVIAALVAVLAAKITVRPAEKQALFAMLSAIRSENEDLRSVVEIVNKTDEAMSKIQEESEFNCNEIEKLKNIANNIDIIIPKYIGYIDIYNTLNNIRNYINGIISNYIVIRNINSNETLKNDNRESIINYIEVHMEEYKEFYRKYKEIIDENEALILNIRENILKK